MSREHLTDNISELDKPDSIQAQASAWLARLDGDEPSPEDLRAFKQWVREDKAHIAAFEKVAAAWGELNILTRLPLLLQQQVAAPARPEKAYSLRYIAVAATLVIGLLIGLQPVIYPAQQALYTTAVGEQRSITLPDGSVVQLNTDSRFEFDYRGAVRALYLYQGEAHFSVAKNPARPFEVYAGSGLVRAVGTAFSVALDTRSDNVDVIVTEGVVEIAAEVTPLHHQPPAAITEPAKQPRRVPAGNAAVFDQRAIRVVEPIAASDLQQQLAWRQGLLIFNGESLEEVVDEMARYTDTRIIIKSEAARLLRIGGQFNIADTAAIFKALEQGFGLKVDYATDSLVYLSYDQEKPKK